MCVRKLSRTFWQIALLVMLGLCLGASDGVITYKRMPSISGMPAYAPGEILVKYKTSGVPSSIESFQSKQGIRTIKKLRSMNVHYLKLPPGLSVEEAIKLYRNDSDVEYAEPNYLRYKTTIPDDPYFSSLWGLNNAADTDIDAPEAWDTFTGSDDIIIAVIDSGVDYNHPDLAGNIMQGWDFVDGEMNGEDDPMDYDGHGTHVSGTIAAVGNNEYGVVGVCWQAKIMPLRFLDSLGSGYLADELSAIQYAIDHGADIINASFGGSEYSIFEYNAISAANDAGILFVTAAGNETNNNDGTNKYYPACYDLPNIISVAATNQSDELCDFSNYGVTSVDVGAPGYNIYSTVPARQEVWSDNFGDMSGWTTGGTNNSWAPTASRSYSSPYSLTDSPGENYQNNTDSWARSPTIDLASHKGAILDFKIYGESEEDNDRLDVEASTNGTTWTKLPILIDDILYESGFSGSTSGWETAHVDLKVYEGVSTVSLRFHFISDGSTVKDGWYIDNVKITASSTSYIGTEYQYYAGTSMAAPHVSGLAALIWAYKPALSHLQVRDAILNSVDVLVSLSGKVATGGRINAYRALGLLDTPPDAPTSLTATAVSGSRIDLAWSDNADNEIGFVIERKQEGGSYAQVATVGANVTSYSNTGLAASTTYYYKIKAYNFAGSSAYSNEASAITLEASDDEESGGICFIATAQKNPALPALAVIALLWIYTLGNRRFRKNKS